MHIQRLRKQRSIALSSKSMKNNPANAWKHAFWAYLRYRHTDREWRSARFYWPHDRPPLTTRQLTLSKFGFPHSFSVRMHFIVNDPTCWVRNARVRARPSIVIVAADILKCVILIWVFFVRRMANGFNTELWLKLYCDLTYKLRATWSRMLDQFMFVDGVAIVCSIRNAFIATVKRCRMRLEFRINWIYHEFMCLFGAV